MSTVDTSDLGGGESSIEVLDQLPGESYADLAERVQGRAQVQPPNRGYAGYYLPNLFQENYRIRTAEELDALPVGSVVVAVDQDRSSRAYCQCSRPYPGAWWELAGSSGVWASVAVIDHTDVGTWLFVVYRPDVIPKRGQ